MENELLTELEQKIGYQFKDKGLLKHAMSHSSYAVSYTHLRAHETL